MCILRRANHYLRDRRALTLYNNGPVHKRMNRVPKDVSERDSALS